MVTIFTIADITSVKVLLLQADLFCKWSKNNFILQEHFSTG